MSKVGALWKPGFWLETLGQLRLRSWPSACPGLCRTVERIGSFIKLVWMVNHVDVCLFSALRSNDNFGLLPVVPGEEHITARNFCMRRIINCSHKYGILFMLNALHILYLDLKQDRSGHGLGTHLLCFLSQSKCWIYFMGWNQLLCSRLPGSHHSLPDSSSYRAIPSLEVWPWQLAGLLTRACTRSKALSVTPTSLPQGFCNSVQGCLTHTTSGCCSTN